jgi:hypothetical protein
MATSFTIIKTDFGNAPAAVQTMTFEYKLFSATSYILISNSALVNTDGTLLSPLTVSGLAAGQLYYIRAHSNCDSPPDFFIQQVQT